MIYKGKYHFSSNKKGINLTLFPMDAQKSTIMKEVRKVEVFIYFHACKSITAAAIKMPDQFDQLHLLNISNPINIPENLLWWQLWEFQDDKKKNKNCVICLQWVRNAIF